MEKKKKWEGYIEVRYVTRNREVRYVTRYRIDVPLPKWRGDKGRGKDTKSKLGDLERGQ